MTEKHTAEPWFWCGGCLMGKGGEQASMQIMWCDEDDEVSHPSEADARRIVAAINACQNIPTEALEDGVISELVKRLETLAVAVAQEDNWTLLDNAINDLLYSLAKLKGGG